MQGTKLLLLTLVVYVSGRGLPNYESSNVWPHPLDRPSYTPNAGPVNPVFSAPPVNQPPLDRSSLEPVPAYQPAISQPSPDQKPSQLTIPPICESESVPVPEYKIPSQPISPQPAIPEKLDPRPRHIKRRSLNACDFKACTEALTSCTATPPPCTATPAPCTETPTPSNETATPSNETATPSSETATPSNETATSSTELPTSSNTIQLFECSRGNGYYPIVNESDAYIECQSDKVYKLNCPDGLHFNSQAVPPISPCTNSSEVKCDNSTSKCNGQAEPDTTARSEICTKQNGFFMQVGSCDSYIECREFHATNKTCPEGLRYNPSALWPDNPCGYPTDVPCLNRGSVQPARPTAECPHQYGLFPALNSTPSNCGGYRKCVEGRAIDMACSIGLAFNDVTKRCAWPYQVPSCNAEEFLGFKCPLDPVNADGELLDMNYKYEKDSHYYFSCSRGRPLLMSCAFGLVFDQVQSKCVDVV